MPGAAEAEAAGLAWLAEPAVAAVPAVHAHDDRWLVIEHVEPGRPTAAAAERFGRELAALHAAAAPAHGAPPAGGPVRAWIGRAPMVNDATACWAEFYVEHRVQPYLRHAAAIGVLDAAEATIVSKAADAIPAVAGPAEPASRLHGDLWSG